jgi:hypothetical protein
MPCICNSEVCGHANGYPCGKPVKVELKYSVDLGEGKFGPEQDVGICDACWGNVQGQFPQLFGLGK